MGEYRVAGFSSLDWTEPAENQKQAIQLLDVYTSITKLNEENLLYVSFEI
jgi:hypothetical protein